MKPRLPSLSLWALFYATYCASAFSQSPVSDVRDDKNICNYVSETAHAAHRSLSFDDLNKDKGSPFVREHLIQTVTWDDTGTTPTLATPEHPTNTDNSTFYESHVRWAQSLGYLPYRGNWYKILGQTDSGANRGARSSGALITAVMGKDETLICAFDAQIKEVAFPTFENTKRSLTETKMDCQDAVDPRHEMRADTPLPEAVKSNLISEMGQYFPPGKFERNVYLVPPFQDGKNMPRTQGVVLKVDINNDGVTDTLLRVNYSEGSNYPCGAYYFDLLSNDMTDLGDPKLRDALLRAQGMGFREDGNLQLSCGRSHTILSVDGRSYVSSTRKLSRHISVIENNETTQLCRSNFAVIPNVVFDASNKPEDK